MITPGYDEKKFGEHFLEDIVGWIANELDPDEVFSQARLKEWAEENGEVATALPIGTDQVAWAMDIAADLSLEDLYRDVVQCARAFVSAVRDYEEQPSRAAMEAQIKAEPPLVDAVTKLEARLDDDDGVCTLP